MLAKAFSAAISGVDAFPIEIEINATNIGEDTTVAVVGLPDAAVRESRQRVRSALESSGFLHPFGHTIISLAPADVKKEGAAFDLPIALGMLAASKNLERELLEDKLVVGELALDGGIRPVRGILPMAIMARERGIRSMLLPEENAREAGVVQGLEVVPIRHLLQAVAWLKGEEEISPVVTDIDAFYQEELLYQDDMLDIKGQELVRRALEVAAAGGHNVLLIGPPRTARQLPIVALGG